MGVFHSSSPGGAEATGKTARSEAAPKRHEITSEGKKQVILAGNPNCGKSVIFNHLTGMYVNVSNFPGTTVDISRGSWLGNVLIDTPGVYGIGSESDEERITRESVLAADVVINVVNVITLERDLFLTLQLVDLGIPMVIVLNMMDEAEKLGLKVDMAALQQATGVPVVPVVAISGKGFDQLAQAISRPRRGIPHSRSLKSIQALGNLQAAGISAENRAELLLVAEGDADIAVRLGMPPGTERDSLYAARRRRADKLAAQVVKGGGKAGWGQRLGEWSARPLLGLPILAAVLYCLYWLVGVLIAQVVVGYTEGVLLEGYYEPFARRLFAPVGDGTVAYRMLVGQFGLFTMTVTYLFGLLLPLVTGFYLALSLLEDSGYLPRIALLADKALNRIGLNGRAVIPMILGMGCVTMAVLTTRVLTSRRERTIALSLLGIAVPCSAQLGVITALVLPLGLGVALAYAATVFVVYALVGTALHHMLPGESTDLLLDLPPLRWPRPGNIFKKTWSRVYGFLSEALPIFAAGVLLVSLLQETGALFALQQFAAPITVQWLRLPAEAAQAFLMGLVRRDFGAAGLYSLTLAPEQKLVAAVTITLFVPCIASMMMLFKERGARDASIIFLGAVAIALFIGGVISRLAGWLWPLLA